MSILRSIKNIIKGRSGLESTLSRKLCKLNRYGDTFTVRDACESVVCFGEIGSGKSSLLNELLLKAYLRSGMGGVINVVKAGDTDKLIRIIKQCGREHDLVVFNDQSRLSFSVLQYFLNRKDPSAKEVTNLSNLLMRIYHITKNYRENSETSSSDHFWEDSLESLIQYTIQLLILSGNKPSVVDMQRIILDLFDEDDLRNYNRIWAILTDNAISDHEKKKTWKEYTDWSDSNAFLKLFHTANSRKNLSSEELEQLEQVGDYFLKVIPKIGEKTRSIITQTYLTLIQPFQSGMLRRHFTDGVSDELRPEQCWEHGKIIIIDFPVVIWGLPGIYAASIVKTSFQMAAERRTVSDTAQPAFLWLDEAQKLVSNYDTAFQLISRDKLIASVYITQTLPALRSSLSQKSGGDQVKSFISNLGLKIFLANSCIDTNNMASDLIGHHMVNTTSTTIENTEQGRKTLSQSRRKIVSTESFTMLRTGGPPNYRIEAIMFKAGRQWRSGKNYNRVEYKQAIS